jgi:hypothetical protein
MRFLPRRARLALLDWSRRYSGYDKHMAELHPVPGYLDWGDVRFKIKTVTFEGGRMHVTADAGTTEAGQVIGTVVLTGTDGKEVLRGTQHADMGVKLNASTWAFKWDVRLPGKTADDTSDAPQPA